MVCAHVHNYQRFTRDLRGGQQLSYIVAGSGGYWNLHYVQKQPNGNQIEVPFKMPDVDGVTLENYSDDHHGFLRITVSQKKITGEYCIVPRPQDSWRAPAKKVDGFEIDLQKHTVISTPTVP